MQGNPAPYAQFPPGPDTGMLMGPGGPAPGPVGYPAPAMPAGKAVPYAVPVAAGAPAAPLVNIVPVAGGVIPLPACFGATFPIGKVPVGPPGVCGCGPAFPTWGAPVAPGAPYLVPVGMVTVGPFGTPMMDP